MRPAFRAAEVSEFIKKEVPKCTQLLQPAVNSTKFLKAISSISRKSKARAAQIRGVVAGQFSGLAEILYGMKAEFERYETCDTAAAARITAAAAIPPIRSR